LKEDFQQGIHVLGCFDECDESAIWFLSEIHKLLLRSEHCLKLLITTTKGTPGDQRITTALSEFPAEHIRKIDHDPKEPVPFSVETEASKLMKKFGEYVGTDHDRDVLSALCSCADDHDLCELVLEWLGSDTKELKRIQWLHNKTLTPALIFPEILDGMAEMQRPWAKILLSWLLTCYRPLRCDELCRVSDIVWLQVEGGKTTPPVLSEIIRNFGGLITSTNGEIRFRHPNTCTWLESHSSSAGEMTWYYTTETRSHEGILQTCISYFQEAAERPEYAAQRLPYAIEFWSKHWQQVDTSEKQLLDLFENDSVFQFWAQSLFAMPNTQLKPPSTHIKPLPVAAHLGLVAVVETLLERNQDQAESRGQALIEACRAGHVAVIRLLMNSYSDDLDFSDENLHEAARVASHSGNDEALRELVSKLPKPPCTLSSEESKTEESEQSVKASENAQANDLPDDSLNGASRGEDDAEGILPEERVPGPLEWLVKPMYRAAGSGMDDVVTRLLQLGVDPNPPENTTPNSNSFIYTAVNNSHISCAKLLMHAGASLTAKNAQGHTALHTATEWASGETVEFLLEQGASIGDEAPGNHRTALNMAAIWGSFTALEAILSRKDAVESLVHDSDRHPVNQAVDNENKKCLKLLLSHGFSPNIVTSTGETALRTAIQNGRLDLCKMLIENNADPDLTPDGANTPLIQAISKGDLDIVKLLIENKATVDKREAPPYEGWSRTPSSYLSCLERYILTSCSASGR
jgi:ankyrin repeat protein